MCVCMCMCMCVHACALCSGMHVHAHECMGSTYLCVHRQRPEESVRHLTPLFSFFLWNKISHWTRCWPFWLDQLASTLPGSGFLCPLTVFQAPLNVPNFYVGAGESNSGTRGLHSKWSYPLWHLFTPSFQCQEWNFFIFYVWVKNWEKASLGIFQGHRRINILNCLFNLSKSLSVRQEF